MTALLWPMFAGLGLFLGGMRLMRLGLLAIAGDKLQRWLLTFTRTPSRGMITGTLITMLVQSSSAVTVITIGLVNARLLTFPQTVGIILGTNIGTTFTTQLIALNPHKLALPLFMIGGVMYFVRHTFIKALGASLAGFGCIFLGIRMMQAITGPLQESHFFLSTLAGEHASNLNGIVLGAAFTALLHSGSAVTALTMGFVNEHILSLTMGIAIILGSNVGTCITAILAAIGSSAAAKQVAWVHVFLNVAGVLLFWPFIGPLADLLQMLTNHPDVQIAHAQTLFNVICSVLALPFVNMIARLARMAIPDE